MTANEGRGIFPSTCSVIQDLKIEQYHLVQPGFEQLTIFANIITFPVVVSGKKLSGGMSCLMYSCFNKESLEDGVTVRARTNTFKDFPHVRESAFELKIVQTMSAKGLFPEVLATFQNGYCYTYVQGQPLFLYTQLTFSLDDMIMRLMARKLAEIHCTKVDGCDYTKTNYFRNLYTLLEEKYPVDDKLPNGCPTRDDLYAEVKMLEERAVQMDSTLVLCHGDPHPGNIVKDKEKGILTYVDWEVSHIGYQASDVGYALQVLRFIGMNPVLTIELPEDYDRKYIRYYLEKWFELQDIERDVSDEDVNKLESQANIFRLSAQLFWIILMVAQFCVAMPDHIDENELKTVQESVRRAQEEALAKTPLEDGPESDKIKFDINATPEEQVKQMVNGIYAGYLTTRDEILEKK